MTTGGCPAGAGAAVDWVLGTLEGEEAERFRRHLETCPSCTADVARLQRVADALAESPAPARPPASIRARLVAVTEEEAAISRALDDVDAPPAGRRRPARLVQRMAAGAAVLVLAPAVALVVLRPSNGPSRPAGPRTLVGTVSEDGGGSRARAAMVTRGDAAELVLTDVAGPPRGRVYQAWVVRPPAAPLATGALFSVPRTGDTRVRLPDVRRAERVIVTAEPPRGSRVPSEPPRVIVLIPR